MAKTKLLLLGKLLAMLAIPVCACGMATNEDFAKEISTQAINMTWEHLLQTAKESNLIEDLKLYMKDTRLIVFVSSSMSLALLKTYAQEASKYGATLVFKGLPEGSFKNLSNLVAQIDPDGKASLQIDEEAFDKYSVSTVPSIVLSHEENCLPSQNCKVTFDKITGNIGIQAALERFSLDGELSSLAGEILHYDD